LVSAGKDISNPGALGTLGMLLESSKKGAYVDLTEIPRPSSDKIDFVHWLKVYQGCGFVVSSKPENCDAVLERFGTVGLTAAIAGEITDDRKLIIEYGSIEEVLFNFNTDKITGIE
jgi:selenophosphate synthetase-related protein